MGDALKSLLVVSVEQAVAAPLCSARLREAGARVIKVERPGGDFARAYDGVAGGDSSYFFWLNQGKESLELDFKNPPDAELLGRIIGRADVLIQNLAPGALARSGFDLATLRERYPRLITCDISGYGNDPGGRDLKAYDLLVQGESGLISISGGKNELGRIGVSICDIGAGMTAHAGILEALLERERTGRGSAVEVSLFGVAADWMTVPLLHHDYAGRAPGRTGLNHPTIAPYGAYPSSDGELVIISIQNGREWTRFCEHVLRMPKMAGDEAFRDNDRRVANRATLDQRIFSVTRSLSREDLVNRLEIAEIAYGAVNSVADFSGHPALTRRRGTSSGGDEILFPTRPVGAAAAARVPAAGEHTRSIREEFRHD